MIVEVDQQRIIFIVCHRGPDLGQLGGACGIKIAKIIYAWEGSGKISWIFCFGSADGVLLYRSTIFLAMGALFVDHNHGTARDEIVHGVISQADDAQSKLT